jgi:DNA topoisomerase VI subunit B
MPDVLRREVAVLNRSMEFFTEKDLTARMGGSPGRWPAILIKELIDNALDAAEGVRPPSVELTVTEDGFAVADNGPGLPAKTLKGSLDYNVRVSDKSLYVTPTRGQLGNALKCVWAAPFVAHGCKASAVAVLSGGRCHAISVSADQIQGCPRIEHVTADAGPVKIGTSIEVAWPGVSSYGGDGAGVEFYRLLRGFAALNPHAAFAYTAGGESRELSPTDPSWRKWLPAQRPSPHWYNLDRLRSLVAGKLASARRSGGRPQRLRDFIGENFNGLKGTVVRGELLRDCGLEGRTLEDLAKGDALDDGLLSRLLAGMQEHARPTPPKRLGLIGKPHLTAAAATVFGADEESVRYSGAVLEVDGLPYVLEVAFGYRSDDDGTRVLTAGVNWSPSPRVPFGGLEWHLRDNRVYESAPCVMIVHLACPRPEFTDTGKTVLNLPTPVELALGKCVGKVTSAWRRLYERAEREDARTERLEQREIAESLRREKAGFLTIKEACHQVMEEAYREASGGGARPANARQIMYAARRLILQRGLTDPEKGKDGFFKKSSSFTQGVLPDYMEQNPEATKRWDVAFDDRGHFAEPHTGLRIGVGTLAVRNYMYCWSDSVPNGVAGVELRQDIETCGPANRYRFALFVEKEGFDALLASERFQQRYDLALMSTKGMSVTAARRLVEGLSAKDVTLLVLHDFDKSGLSILHTLRSNTRRYKYRKKPKVIDLGLRLADVRRLSLLGERVTYPTAADPKENLRRSGASKGERDFLVSGGRARRWEGVRVELNELTSPQFVEFLEEKLAAEGVCKVVPDGEALTNAYQFQVRRAALQRAIDEAAKKLNADAAAPPADLHERLRTLIEGKSIPWDRALWELVKREKDPPPRRRPPRPKR